MREHLGDPRVVPSFRLLLSPDMSPSMTPEVPMVAHVQFLHHRHWPSQRSKMLGILQLPQIRFPWGSISGLHWFASAATCQVARLPSADLTGLPPANGDFYFQAFDELVTRLIAGYNYGSYWTTLPVGLSPTRTAASFAAVDPDEPYYSRTS